MEESRIMSESNESQGFMIMGTDLALPSLAPLLKPDKALNVQPEPYRVLGDH